jgi:predicted nuclease of predicted toxin-antitoxin system
VKLLVDQNLSYKLVGLLCDLFPNSAHVGDVGLRNAGDDEVWKYAATHGYLIVTKDEDFNSRSAVHRLPPKVIWIQTGNCATDRVHVLLRRNFDEITEFEQQGDIGVLALL